MKRRTLIILILSFLIGIGVILRLWHLPELFHFTYDEEIIAFVGKRMWVNHHIPLIGGVTPMHIHAAPYYYWFSGLWLGLFQLNPLGWGIIAAVIAAITMVLIYFTGKTLFNTRVGLLAVFLYSFSFYQNIFDRHYWGLILNGLWSLLTLLALRQILAGKYKFIWVIGAVWFFALHTDPSTLVLYVFTSLALLAMYFKPSLFKTKSARRKLVVKLGIVVISCLLVSILPLILFDVRHDFSNSRGILDYIAEVKSGRRGIIHTSAQDALLFLPQTLARSLYVFGNADLASQYSYCTQHAQGRLQAVPTIFTLLLFGIVICTFWKGNTEYGKISLRLLGLLFLSTYAGVVVYGIIFKGDLFDHYVSTMFPPFYIILSFFLTRLGKWRLISIAVCLIFLISNLWLLKDAHHRFGYKDKIDALAWVFSQIGDKPYSLDALGSCFRYNGYRYLTYLLGKEPAKSYVDVNFTHLYDVPPAQTHPDYLVVITNPDFTETSVYNNEYQMFAKKMIASRRFGDIEAMIINNKGLEFRGKF